MKRGVGWTPDPGAAAVWESGDGAPRLSFPIDTAARPWGTTGDDAFDRDAFLRRYAAGQDVLRAGYWAQGQTNKLHYVNRMALEHWFQQQPASHRAQWDGVPTEEEQQDLAVTTPRRADFYGNHWYRQLLGGSPDNPIVVTEGTYRTYRVVLEGAKVGTLGRHTIPTTWPWPLYVDVRWLPAAEPLPPADEAPPPPTPKPEPPPAVPAPDPGRVTPRRRAEEWHETIGALLVQAGAPRWARKAWWLGRGNFLLGAEPLITLKRSAEALVTERRALG